VRDYHTVDLGRPHLQGTGWTTRGAVEERSGASGDTTHIRYRWYLADALVLVALTLIPTSEQPTLADLTAALLHPARPLFIGRKPCLPTAPVLLTTMRVPDAITALREGAAQLDAACPPVRRGNMPQAGISVEIDEDLVGAAKSEAITAEVERLVDRRDWRNQMHTGGRAVRHIQVTGSWECP
jgi:CRISPR system Cascade subunit CasD